LNQDVNLEMLTKLANRCVLMAAGVSLPLIDGTKMPISISLGATLARLDETREELIHRADKLMYQSKISGRGCGTVDWATLGIGGV
jgi:GGDEF domain-containing protein